MTQYGINVIDIKQRRKLYKITAEEGVFSLKEYSRVKQVAFQVAALEHLAKQRFEFVPKIVYSKTGNPLSTGDGKYFFLTEWIEGSIVSINNLQKLEIASSLLAHFHLFSSNIESDFIKQENYQFNEGVSFFGMSLSRMKDLLMRWSKEYKSEALLEAFQMLTTISKDFPEDQFTHLVQLEKNENAFIHGDYNYPNIIDSPNKSLYLIDFDKSQLAIRITDLLNFCHLHMGEGGERCMPILKAYHKVRPLSQLEFDVLKFHLLFPSRIIWNVISRQNSKLLINSEWITKNITPFLSSERKLAINRITFSALR